MQKKLMTVWELSEYIGTPVSTLYSYVSRGKIPAECVRHIGRSLRFDLEAVNRWIAGL